MSKAVSSNLTEQARAVITDRRRQQHDLIEIARSYVSLLQENLILAGAAVVGSVARGDFNIWSDIDILIVAGGLPERLPDRLDALNHHRPPRVQVIGFTPAEFGVALGKRNPMVLEALAVGVTILGHEFFAKWKGAGNAQVAANPGDPFNMKTESWPKQNP